MAIQLDLPAGYRGPYHLTWYSEDGRKVDEVGVVYKDESGATMTEIWDVNGNQEKARKVIEKDVLAFLRETFNLAEDGSPNKPADPAPAPVPASPDFTKVATRRGDQPEKDV